MTVVVQTKKPTEEEVMSLLRAREQDVQFLTLTLKFESLDIENSQNPSPTKVPKEETPNPLVKVSNLDTPLL